MARKETVNTFTDGLISDLNPINTPNTVLTDCLNGTLITYDGNEYSLQNDKGNFPLKDCKLPENYIPVGVKEYGDILYIISYNPITKHVQIGSYPSPETIFDEFDIQGNSPGSASYDNNLSYSVDSIWDSISSTYNYSELTEDLENLKLFYGPIPENYKINPGDKYKVHINDGANNNAQLIENLDLGDFEGIEFYIFDENRKPYDITKNIETNTNNFVYTNWKVPGYMATKLRFASVDDFKVNIRKIIVPTYTITGQNAIKELSLNFQYFISDYLYNDHTDITSSCLGIKIEILKNNISLGTETASIDNVIDLKNGTLCYYSDWTLPSTSPYDAFLSTDSIELIITPFVSQYVESPPRSGSKQVFYDKFKRIIKFDLSQKGNVNDFSIGDGLWRYNVGNELILYFDTAGIQETSVFSQDVALQYKIKRVSELSTAESITNWENSTSDWNDVYDWNIIGDSILKINLDPWEGSVVSGKIYAEDYYYITFRFIDPDNNDFVLRKGLTKTILATELLNDNSSKRYDKVYFDEWINNYTDHIKNKYVNVTANIDQNNQSTFLDKSAYYNIWKANGEITKYPTFKSLNEIDTTTDPNPEFTITGGINFNTNVTYTSDVQLPVGPMWQGLQGTINFNDHTQKNIISSTGLVDTTGGNATDTQINKLEKTLKYILRNNSVVNSLFNFNETNLSIPASSSEIVIEPEGIYEDQIDLDAGPDPDLRVKISGSTIATFINDTSSYINNVTSYLLNKFNYYDVLFVVMKMNPQTVGDDTTPSSSTWNHNSLRFKTGETIYDATTNDSIYAAASDLLGSTTYYAVFKIKDTSSGKFKLLFIPVGETTVNGESSASSQRHVVTSAISESVAYNNKFKVWAQNIKRLRGDGVQVIGGFYKAFESKVDDKSNVINITTSPYILFSEWTYLSTNMFSDGARLTISNRDNFFKNSNHFTRNVLLSGIYFDQQNTEITYTGSTSELDALLELEKTAIATRNTQVGEDILAVSSDTNLNRFKDNPDIDLYIDQTDTNGTSLLVKFLNKEQTSDTPIMFVTFDNWAPPTHNHISYPSGYYEQYNYMGVTEIGLVINPTT